MYDRHVGRDFLTCDVDEFEKQAAERGISTDQSEVYRDGTRQLKPTEVPNELVLSQKRKSLPGGFKTIGSLFVIQDAVVDILQELDPDVHQFLPISLRYKGGSVPDGKFFVLNVTARQDSIIDKQSSVKSVPLPKQIHPYVPGDHDPERMKIIHFRKNVTVDPKKQAGLNMWRERRYAGSYLISDTFFDALKSQNLRLMGSFKAKDLHS